MKNLFKKKEPKIFCISFQRTGTTSVGKFFRDHGFNVQGYNPFKSFEWTGLYFQGNYEAIFEDNLFKKNQVFEDNPWWCLDFYKFLYHRFPNAKFVLLNRDPDKWFNSMVSHSKGKTLGNTFRHAKTYRRENDFAELNLEGNPYQNQKIDNGLDLNESHRQHYIDIYNTRNIDILNFFQANDSSRLVTTTLENPDKWKVIAGFFKINISKDYEAHANKSVR